MGVTQGHAYCPTCRRETETVRDEPNHIVHAIITVLGCLLYAPIWAIIAYDPGPEKCTACDTTVAGGKAGLWIGILLAGYAVVVALVVGLGAYFVYESQRVMEEERSRHEERIRDFERLEMPTPTGTFGR